MSYPTVRKVPYMGDITDEELQELAERFCSQMGVLKVVGFLREGRREEAKGYISGAIEVAELNNVITRPEKEEVKASLQMKSRRRATRRATSAA